MRDRFKIGALLVLIMLGIVVLTGQNAGNTGTATTFKQVFTAQSSPAISSVVIPNIGATSHWLTYCPNGAITALTIQLEGSNDNTNFFPISHSGSNTGPLACYVLQASGYFQELRANLTVFTTPGGGTVTAFYTGSSGPIAGNFPLDAVQVAGPAIVTANQTGSGNVPVQIAATNNLSRSVSSLTNASASLLETAVRVQDSPGLSHISGFCSAGTATLRVCYAQAVTCSSNIIWQLPVGTTPVIATFPTPLMPPPGNVNLLGEITACGAGNTGTMNVVFSETWTINGSANF
jgi:hypothetical protein